MDPGSPDAGWRIVVQWMKHDRHDLRFPGGESYNDIAARFMPFIDRLEETYGHTEANVLIVSHGTALTTMLPLLLSNVNKSFVMSQPHFDGTFYVVAELRGSEWVCLRWRDNIF